MQNKKAGVVNCVRCKNGFTLIELLVVVLIIGILAALAVPQYQKAVDKATFTQAHMILKSVHRAQQTFWLANGNYATTWDELGDLELPNPTSGGGTSHYIYFTWGYCFMYPTYGGCGFNGAREIQDWGSDKSACYASKTSTRAQEICRAVTQNAQAHSNGNNYTYLFP